MNNPVSLIAKFLFYLFFQVLFLRNFSLYETAHCYFYISFLLFLPIEFPAIPLLLIGFGLGFMVDLFYDTGGIHTSACVLVAFLRPFLLNSLRPSGGYEAIMEATPQSMGLRWFFSYGIVLITAHQFVLFFLDAFSFHLLLMTIFKFLASIIFTIITIAAFQMAFRRFS